jgi:hypothetical protein
MRSVGRQSLKILGPALMLSGITTAFGQDLLNLRLYNDTSDQVVVTVYDMNATPPGPVLVRQIIEGFAWFPVLVTPSIAGHAHVKWTAETAGGSFHRCGHQEKRRLQDDAIVHIFTDSRCLDRTS